MYIPLCVENIREGDKGNFRSVRRYRTPKALLSCDCLASCFSVEVLDRGRISAVAVYDRKESPKEHFEAQQYSTTLAEHDQ